MPTLNSNGVSITYETYGDGAPIVLIHGFASSFKRNWYQPGWVEHLTLHGFQVIGLDVRGHGESEKLYDPILYRIELMAEDVLCLLDHLNIAQADVMGYSMGARIVLQLITEHGARFRNVILGGIGDHAISTGLVANNADALAAAMEATDASTITDPVARNFRSFAERGGNDLRALAAVMRRPSSPLEIERVRRITQPVLIVLGEQDDLVQSAHQLVQLIPRAQLVMIPNRNHNTTVGDKRYKEAVVKFLREA